MCPSKLLPVVAEPFFSSEMLFIPVILKHTHRNVLKLIFKEVPTSLTRFSLAHLEMRTEKNVANFLSQS